MIATGVPSRPRPPSGPDSPSSCRKATPDHDGRQHERHQQRRRRISRARQREPVQRVRGRQPEQDGDAVATAEDHTVNHATRSTRGRVSTSSTPAGSKPPSTKKPSRHHGGSPAARRRPPAPAPARGHSARRASGGRVRRRARPSTNGAHLVMTSVHSVSHCSRFAAMSAGEPPRSGVVGWIGVLRPVGRHLDGVAHGEDVHGLRQRGLHLVGEQPVDDAPRRRRGWPRPRARRRTPPGGSRCRAARRWSTAVGDGERRRGVVGHDDRALALAAALGEVAVVGVLPAVDDLGAVGEQVGPVVRQPSSPYSAIVLSRKAIPTRAGRGAGGDEEVLRRSGRPGRPASAGGSMPSFSNQVVSTLTHTWPTSIGVSLSAPSSRTYSSAPGAASARTSRTRPRRAAARRRCCRRRRRASPVGLSLVSESLAVSVPPSPAARVTRSMPVSASKAGPASWAG